MRLLSYQYLLTFSLLLFLQLATVRGRAQVPAASRQTDPDGVCATCHRAIYTSYRKTPMARASGPAAEGLLPGEFTHAPSGVHYRLFLRDGRAWLAYDRPHAPAERSLNGERELQFFIGSGTRGRTYLFQTDGFWFESPVNWYGKQRVWDMNPKSLDALEMPLTLRVDAACLHCHSSGVQAELPGASNHFAAHPFLYGGITCEACHGDPSAHVASSGAAPILNPAKLSPSRRDSICLQCHLEGKAIVNRKGRSLADFVPGQELSEYVTHYGYSGELGADGRATSQWESLLQSKCKRKSGDRMTCITCHDPHISPVPDQQVSYFRSKCLTCHGQASFIRKHHPEQPDCASCHMPRQKTEDVAHEQVTDHRIQRQPVPGIENAGQTFRELKSVDEVPISDRDLGLAYAQLAEHGNQEAGRHAMLLLERAEGDSNQSSDPDLHTSLGFLKQVSGDSKGAAHEYQAALQTDPSNSVAAGNLGILDARSGDVKEAILLWQAVIRNDPAESAASLDLALAECAIGKRKAATQVLEQFLEFSPDDQRARQTMIAITNGRYYCGQ
jgi:predicted CXXCH cytochrome family protein